jgi:hypothetical protein
LFTSFFYPKSGNWGSSVPLEQAYNDVYTADASTGTNVYSLWPLFTYVNDVNITYTPIISTIVGIGIMIYIIKFAFDIGIRAFKLLFLQIIAPVPIISYMDPGKGKDVFKKYVSTYISTYVDLFVRLGIIFLAILLSNVVMAAVTSTTGSTLFASSNLTGLSLTLAKVVVIVAIYQFAIQVPKMLESIFGFNLSGGTSLKGLGSSPLGKVAAFAGGGILGAGVGAAGGLGSSLLRGDFKDENGKVTAGGIGKTIANSLGGGVRSGVGSAQSGWKSGIGKGTAGALTGAAAAGIRRQGVTSEASKAAGGWGNLQRGRLDNALGGEYRAKKKLDTYAKATESASGNVQKAQTNMSAFSNMRNVAEREFAQQNNMSVDDARRSFGSNFDTQVSSWISTNGSANQRFSQAVGDYNLENNLSGATAVNNANFGHAETAARTQNTAARTDLNTASTAESAYKGANKDRSNSREAARNLNSGGKK